jgi:hypothetical protein
MSRRGFIREGEQGMILIFRFGKPVVALALPLLHKTLLHVLQRIIASA